MDIKAKINELFGNVQFIEKEDIAFLTPVAVEKELREKQEQDKILTRYGLSSKDLAEACKHLKAIKTGDFGLFFEDYEKQKKTLDVN